MTQLPMAYYYPLPDEHFLYHPPKEDSPFYVTTMMCNGYQMLLIVNPTDARKRLILRFMGNPGQNIKTTLSRDYTQEELEAFYSCVAKLMFKFQPLGVQLSYAGNNAQSVQNGTIIVGQRKPNMLHVHLVMKFLLPLDQISKEFSLIGPKEKWTDESAAQFRDLIRSYLN
jgi:hypothetical protein